MPGNQHRPLDRRIERGDQHAVVAAGIDPGSVPEE
jgi:hypothetical protein